MAAPSISELLAEISSLGAWLSHLGRNRNAKHFPDKFGWYHASIQPEPQSADDLLGRWSHAWGPTAEIAVLRAVQEYKAWTPPDYGDRVRAELAQGKSKATKFTGSADDLLKDLGL